MKSVELLFLIDSFYFDNLTFLIWLTKVHNINHELFLSNDFEFDLNIRTTTDYNEVIDTSKFLKKLKNWKIKTANSNFAMNHAAESATKQNNYTWATQLDQLCSWVSYAVE
jgi:hypothetical protein